VTNDITEMELDQESPAEEAAEEEFFLTPEDEALPNMVEVFMQSEQGKTALRDISDRCLNEIRSAIDGRTEYVERVAQDWKLFSGDLPKRQPPFQNSANMHVPIALENITRITFHAYGELFGDWSNIFGVLPMGPEDDLTAQILSAHGNWQIRQQIPGFKREMHRALLSFFHIGDVTIQSWWDRDTGLNCHEMLSPDEFITPYSYTTTRPDYSDLPWYARVVTKYKHEMQALKDEWYDVEAVLKGNQPSWDDEPEQVLDRAIKEFQGIAEPDGDTRAPYKLYHYEGWVELPGDDKQRWCQVIVHENSRAVLKLCILETVNWQDKQRFEMQSQELEAFQGAMAQHEAASMQQGQLMQQHDQAMAMGDEQTAMQARMRLQEIAASPLPPPPQPPMWMQTPEDTPEPPKKEPLRLFIHGVCIEPLVGNLGLGYGRILCDYNRAANTALSQFTDAASLGNAKSFLATELVELPQDFRVAPGRWTQVKGVMGQQLKDNVMPLDFGAANNQLLELVSLAQKSGQSAAQSPEVLSGEPGKSGETFRGLSARIEQATKILSVSTRKFLDSPFEQILRNNAFLNSIYLRDEEIFMVANHALRSLPKLAADPTAQVEDPNAPMPAGGPPQQPGAPPMPGLVPLRVGRDMYDRNYEVEFRADLRFASMAQRISEADEIYHMVLADPVFSMNAALRFYTFKKSMEARGKADVVQLMGPAPPLGMMMAPPMPPGQAPPGGPPKGPDSATPPAPPDGVGQPTE